MHKLQLHRGYNILKAVIDTYIKTNNIKFNSSENASSDFQIIKEDYIKTGMLTVYNGGDHGHLGKEYNIKFRAVHDFMHIKYNLSFKFNDERILSDKTILDFRSIASQLGYRLEERRILGKIINAEIRGQIDYFAEHRSYVEDQKEFINNILKVG